MKKILGIVLLFMSFSSFAQDAIYTGFFSDKALEGYDTVAYFTQNKPVKGNSDYSTEYKGAVWNFSTEKNLELFKADPSKYAPQYGGYCAWAIGAKNDFAPGDPLQWSIVDGKLYVNYDKSIKDKWETDRAKFISQANVNWPKLIK